VDNPGGEGGEGKDIAVFLGGGGQSFLAYGRQREREKPLHDSGSRKKRGEGKRGRGGGCVVNLQARKKR